jgi:DNA-binding GntR family transcriptional regulator
VVEPIQRKARRAEHVYQRMRDDIFAVRLSPGQRLKFTDLCATYDTSVGVAREVLVRLAAEHLVVARDQQGYIVVELSESDLLDLTQARLLIEPLVLRESVLHGDADWETGVVAAHYRLTRIEVPEDMGSAAMEEWSKAHEAFHWAISAACPSLRLQTTVAALRAEAELHHRRWGDALRPTQDRDVCGEHTKITDAALAHDADAAAAALREHISGTADVLLAQLPSAQRHRVP